MRPSSPHECGEPDGAPPNAKVDLRPDRPVPGTNMILDITSAPPEFDEVQLIRREHPTHSLELKLSRGTVLHVEGQVEGAKHIQLSPTRPRRPAKLIGSLDIPSASSISSVVMRMYCVMERLSVSISTTPSSSAHPSSPSGGKQPSVKVLWHATSTNHVPSKNSKTLAHPFTFELPTRLERFDTPPSFQRDSFGVRYLLEVIVERGKFTFKRSSHDFLPLTYLPMHPHPSLEDVRPPPEKGSPEVPPKDPRHRFSELSTRIDGPFVWCSVLLSDKGLAARGEPYSVLISIACEPSIADSIIPSCFSVKLRELGQPLSDGATSPKTVVKASEITYYPSHLLPRPSAMAGFAVGAMDYRGYKVTLDIGLEVTPSFSTDALGPRVEYEVEVKVRIPKAKEQVMICGLSVVNCSTEPHQMPKAYLKRDARGGMRLPPEL